MKIVLASTSPRRIELLSQLGLEIEVLPPTVDETPGRGEKPAALVSRLAEAKAESTLSQLLARVDRGVVIAADTIVVAPGGKKILNKPRNRAEAVRMLTSLAGKQHEVLTSYCIKAFGKKLPAGKRSMVRVISTQVRMRKLTALEIRRYVDTGEPMDKAGAYGAQGKGMALIESIEGSYMNVVGLPVCQLLVDLRALVGVELFSWTR